MHRRFSAHLPILFSAFFLIGTGCTQGGGSGPAGQPGPSGNSESTEQGVLPYVSPPQDNYQVGCGIYDITGPAAQVVFFGYVKLKQVAKGIHDRQWARAFIVVDPQTNERVVFVNCDLGAVFYPVVREVSKRLQVMYGNLYTERNMVISATHTHVAPGGHSHSPLYNGPTKGYLPENFEAIVDGTVKAISRAHDNLAPGKVFINKGELWDASINRSIEPYLANVDAASYPTIDPEMVVLKFMQGNTPVGMISWFATHTANFPNTYRFISADNKGYAAYLFEKKLMESDYGKGAFVAAFAQGNAGDMSPNIAANWTGPGSTSEESSRILGERHFDLALELYLDATEQLTGSVKMGHRFFDMSSQVISPQFTDGQVRYTFPSALGTGFAAGSEDGTGLAGFQEGSYSGNPFWILLGGWLMPSTPWLDEGHAPKKILIAPGLKQPHPWSPQILPMSIMKIGQFGALAVPAEFTIMTGRRLKKTVAQVAGTGLTHLTVAGYSNSFHQYVSTFEEYQLQHYEGASTHFGPWTAAAYRQAFHDLATSLASGTWPTFTQEPIPSDLTGQQVTYQFGVIFDGKPFFKSFGDVKKKPKNTYSTGETVTVSFWGGHPKNDRKTQSSFLFVDLKSSTGWNTVYTDNDWCTRYEWKRKNFVLGTSLAIVTWKIPDDVIPGTYRIRHEGARKSPWSGNIYPYSGETKEFQVQ